MTKKEREELLLRKLEEKKAFDREHADGALGKGKGPYMIAGADEVGRGPLAGPVVTACVVLPEDFDVPGIDDSKKLSEKKREELSRVIREKALAVGIGIRDNQAIDKINILEATKEAMRDAVRNASSQLMEKYNKKIDILLLDALKINSPEAPEHAIIKGDSQSLAIGAASIVAKVYRDNMMKEYDQIYPGYSFEKNKGYGTAAHYEGIRRLGITPIHRKSFLKNVL